MAQQKKHIVTTADRQKLLFEFEGQVPRVGEYMTIRGEDVGFENPELWEVTAVCWLRWAPAIRNGTWDGQLFAQVYVRPVEALNC